MGDPLVGLAGGGVADDERRKAAASEAPVRARHVATSSSVVPRGKENVKRMLIDPGNILVKKNKVGAVYWRRFTPARKLRLRRDPKQEGVGYGYCEAKRDGEIDRGGPGRYIGEGRGLGVDG